MKSKCQRYIYLFMFIHKKIWSQPNIPKQMNKEYVTYAYIMEYYSIILFIKRTRNPVIYINLGGEDVMLNETIQT